VSHFRKPCVADYTEFLYKVVGIPEEILPSPNVQITETFHLALDIVNEALAHASTTIYALAVYNLGADRLINYGMDPDDQSFFKDARSKFRTNEVSVGVAAAVGDQGTSLGILNPEQMKLFTLQDLQTLKTPYGRQYMAFAQMYGRSLWGLT
jgi:hypothetical protein